MNIQDDLNSVLITYNQGVAYLETKKYKRAIEKFKEVLKHFPDGMEVHNNLGVAYRALGLDSLMFKHYRLGLDSKTTINSNYEAALGQLLNNLGLAEYMYGRDDVAIKLYTRAIKLNPKAWDAWWNVSTAWLRKASSSGSVSDFEHGWEMYKARFLKSSPIIMKNDRENLVYWDTMTAGSSILVLVEQGIGDNIMFARYLPLLRKKFDEIIVQCDPSLDPLFSEYATVRHASECTAPVAYPMCSLGECFDGVPSAEWLPSFTPHDFGSGFNVGIVWSGSSGHANDAYRSVDIRRFHRLAKYCNLYSLTPGFKGDKYVKGLNPTSWSSTASYCLGLDLVIGVDTSVMHLCGSLGLSSWLLQPYKETDFRWGTVNSEMGSSVWYPKMRIFNNPQSWETVFDRVEEQLVKYIATGS